MASRLKLHEELVGVLGNRNVYFQPPESVKINYPAIIYSRINIGNTHADDNVYLQKHVYRVVVVDRDPDSEIVEKMSKFKYSRHENHYMSDNLYHDVYRVNY